MCMVSIRSLYEPCEDDRYQYTDQGEDQYSFDARIVSVHALFVDLFHYRTPPLYPFRTLRR